MLAKSTCHICKSSREIWLLLLSVIFLRFELLGRSELPLH